MSRSRTLRSLLAGDGVIRLMGAHDAMGAKLAERAGFEGVWSSGLEISTSHGVPDASILTMSEYLAAAQSMVDAVSIPVVADCDTGYGNSNNVIRMVRQFEAAGVAAVCVEDKLFPKVNSLTDGRQELAPIAEFVGKILAAKNAQRTADFVVIARIEALIAGWGVDEAIQRADAYVRAGADAILIHDKDREGRLAREFLQRWPARVPVVVVPTAYPHIKADELHALGAKIIIYANHGIRSAVAAMQSTFARIIADGSTECIEPRIAPLSVLFDLQGMPELERAEQEYLRTGLPPTRAVILSAGDHRGVASMETIAREIPIAALDVNGKTLLRRQVETLARAGIRDVTVVTGYRGDAVQVEGAKVIHNDEWASTGEATSLFSVPDDPTRRTLVIYGDVLFDGELIARLLRSESDATIVVDRNPARRETADESEDRKRRDLVALSSAPPRGRRFLDGGVARPLAKIGRELDGAASDGEFAGFAMFTPEVLTSLRSRFDALLGAAPDRPLHEAAGARTAALTDLVQDLVDRGQLVSCLEVTSGWLELHGFDDYQLACRLVAQ